MKTNLHKSRLMLAKTCSYALIATLLLTSFTLTAGSGGKKGRKKGKSGSKPEINWSFNAYKIRSSAVLTLALTNTLGSGQTQILTGCYNTGELDLYEKTNKGLKLIQKIGTVKGGITDMKLLSMDGAQNKAVVAHEGIGSIQIFDLRNSSETLSLFHGPNSVNHLEIADLNGDGLGDIIPVSFEGRTEVWFQNDGNQGFIKRKLPNMNRRVTAIKVADFDQDGDTDVLLASDYSKMITIFTNDGKGNFTFGTIADGVTGVLDLEVLDMNMDGLMDVAYASYKERKIQLLLNRGHEFEAKNVSTKLKSLNNIEVFDLGKDGRPDLIITSFDEDAIRVVENTENGLKEHQFEGIIPAPTAIAVKTHPMSLKTTFYVSSMAQNKVYAIDMEPAKKQ